MPSVETKANEDSSSLLHSLLTQLDSRTVVPPAIEPEPLPDPVFPQDPELLGDGGLDPPMGTIENHKFETKQLSEIKKSCQPHRFSTLNHILAFCYYNDARVIKWMFRQALNRFQGTTNFD
jgi:hypothetical protein